MEERIVQQEAQTASTTNPTNYATSKYSVEEMDALLDYVSAMKKTSESREEAF